MRAKTIAITGGYLSRNMGAAAMTVVASQHLSRLGYRVELFSKYPGEDACFAQKYGIAIRPANQFVYTFLVIPVLAISTWFPTFRSWICDKYYPGIVAFYDIGGITFSGNRGFTGYAINLTWLLLPLLLGIPIVKGSQAMGPFNRWYLKLTLPLLRRINLIYVRGAKSRNFLDSAGISSESAPDIAFLLEPESAPLPFKNYITIVPSSVVMERYDKAHGKDSYIALITEIIKKLVQSGWEICLLAHSYRHGDGLNNNDYPLCRLIAQRVNSAHVLNYDVFGKTPGQLKTVLAHSQIVFTSRFHAMIAAIDSCVPVVVASWSHKYREVLEIFGLGRWAVPWENVSLETLYGCICSAQADREYICEVLLSTVPEVRRKAMINFQYIPQIDSNDIDSYGATSAL